jgi:hypothetical protein
MAKHLSDRDVERIVDLLDGWRDKLTWGALSIACRPVIGTAPSRQTLFRFVRITDAFKSTKLRLKSVEPETSVPHSMRIACERIARLTAENERLKRENGRLLQQFVVWQYNAHVKGLGDVDLNKPLPSIDRGNTD